MHYSKARSALPLSWARWSNRAMRLQCLSMLARISHGWGLRMAILFGIKRVEGAFNEPHKGAPYRDRVYPSPLAVCTRTLRQIPFNVVACWYLFLHNFSEPGNS